MAEHSARIEPPGRFRPDSFRRKTIAPGIVLVLGKRPRARKTETQAIRFDADRYSPAQVRSWLAAHDYEAISFDWANSGAAAPLNPPPANPASPELSRTRTLLDEARGRLIDAKHIGRSAPDSTTELWRKIQTAINATDDAYRESAFRKTNPDDAGDGAQLAEGDNAHAAVAVAVAEGDGTVAQASAEAPDVPPEPNPRGLVEIALARRLEIPDARIAFSWTLRDGWVVLAPPGAELLPPGQGRLFLVPGPKTEPTAEPKPGAAWETFEVWHQFPPDGSYQLDVPRCDEFHELIGHASRIIYRSNKWSKDPIDYDHEFKRSDPPEVLIIGRTEAPRAILVRGGAFRLTGRGLVD